MTRNKQVRNLLNQVLVKEMNYYHFYYDGVRNLEEPTAVRLFENLAESSAGFIDAVETMLRLDTFDVEIIADCDLAVLADPPDPTPIDPHRAETNVALEACNEAIENEWESFTFLLSCAGDVDEAEFSDTCRKLACLKAERIDWIRAVAEHL